MKLIKKLASLAMGNNSTPVLGELDTNNMAHRYRSYPSRGLTPEGLSALFAEADEGRTMRQMELYDEMMEKDAHLGSVLQTRKLAVMGLEWEVSPASHSRPEDAEVAAFVRQALRDMDGLDAAMGALMDAAGRGFSICEVIWEIVHGQARISWLRPMEHKNFTFMDRQGLMREPRLLTDAEPIYGEPLMPGKFVVHYGTGGATHPVRSGALRPCAWMYLFKNYTLKDWVVFSERFAQPMRIGKFSPGATEADRRALRQAVFNLGSDAAAIISDSTVIELLEAEGRKGSAEVYERLASYCDRSMSKAVLGQTLTTEQSGGAYATAKVHESVRRDILEADANALARTLRASLIRPLVQYNFGPDAALPVLRFMHEPGGDLRQLAETYKVLSTMGIAIPQSHIRERFGIPAGATGGTPPSDTEVIASSQSGLAGGTHTCDDRSAEVRHVQ